MISMTDKICVCHMQANAYKYHLQKYLFSSKNHSKLSVKNTVSLLINLQIMSETFQEVSILSTAIPKPIIILCINMHVHN